ncbi:MAG: hypothetical protein ACREVX_15440 [Clostridium sp.]|uniref:hypothetical protein n=1 Tax=Clostridium sp. TaxID=1506 RepID=UPI003D6D3A8E
MYLPISYSKDDFYPALIHEIVKFTDFNWFQPFVTLRNDSLAQHLLKSAMGLYINDGKYRYEKASLKLKEFFILLAEEISVQNSPKEQLKKYF